MKKQFFILIITILSIGSSLFAQQLYTTMVGTFVDIRPQDFDNIRPLGFIYAQQIEGNLNQVYLGNFSNKTKAQQLADAIKAQGFSNAQVIPFNYTNAPQAAVIQVATRYTNRPLNWAELQRAGDLNVIVEDERIKIFTVTFPDINTAKNNLPRIQALGFSDAFVKTVNSARLLPVSPISTGIKKELIPLKFSETTAKSPNQPTTSTVRPDPTSYNTQGGRIITSSTPSVPQPAEYNNGNLTARTVEQPSAPISVYDPPPAPTQAVNNKAAARPIASIITLPNIRGDIKRSSSINLQKIMKEEGYYSGSLDGYYGPGTSQAYNDMLVNDPTVLKYKLLSSNISDFNTSPDIFFKWEEVQLLYTIAMDLNPPAIGQTNKLNAAAVKRYQLSLTTSPLHASEETLLNNWENSTWATISQWASTDLFLLETTNALRFAYYQSQVRLEDYYMDKGFEPRAAKTLALASLQAIVGVAFERF